MFLASIFAFLKMFYKTSNFTIFIVLGVLFSVFEFILRVPSVLLGNSVVILQIIWVAMNFITSSLLGIYMYGENLELNMIIGMVLILLGVCISTGSVLKA
jgi:multidrug transporter EmrE-like cation transporter